MATSVRNTTSTGPTGILLGSVFLLLSCGTSNHSFVQSSQSSLGSALDAPVITSASSMPISVGVPFHYQITATNRPAGYAAQNLPPGLSLDTTTGTVSGVPQQEGAYDVLLTAWNAAGGSTMHLFLSGSGEAENCGSSISPPQPALSSGFTSMSFCDDFNSDATIDTASTGRSGYNWYTNLPSWYSWRTLPS